jgi:TetR/AcrR family transcriptional regulator, transcriptional repressor for nem operon
MGHSQADKAKTHERIVAIAARRFREAGLDGMSIADLMKEAGLTHGGFYKHFQSREDLVQQALAAALQSSASPDSSGAPAGEPTYVNTIDAYLSPRHRDAVGSGCAVAALVSDVGRAGAETKALLTRKIRRNFEDLQLLGGAPDATGRARAIVAFSAMAGALGLARAVDDEALGAEILETVRTFLIDR